MEGWLSTPGWRSRRAATFPARRILNGREMGHGGAAACRQVLRSAALRRELRAKESYFLPVGSCHK
jgi:hypothetical protein